jgi:L-ascorbate metabolism protein UlaG (beta-lactamase superfamily)
MTMRSNLWLSTKRLGLVSAFAAIAGLSTTPAAGQMLAGDHVSTDSGDLIVHEVGHASFVMGWNGRTIYVDPVGDGYGDLPPPDLILITDVHGDHLNADTLRNVAQATTRLVAPAAVAEQLPAPLQDRTTVIANGEQQTVMDVAIEAVPMYNLTEERLNYHEKGRGNGYVVTLGGRRIYISGDTEDIPEMRALEDIDVAFVCFNLPYTMTEEQAASAVREFQPAIVYPYHYRGSDVQAFASLVGQDSGVDVRILEGWY